MARSRPAVYRNKSPMKWTQQKLLSDLHFRRQVEEELDLWDINNTTAHTYVYELQMENGAYISTEDGALIYSNAA
jgi:hypothetical protein